MEFKPYKVDGFLTDWYKIHQYPLTGSIHTIYNHKNGNPPHILYEKEYEVGKPPIYDNMAVISTETGEVLHNGHILTEHEKTTLAQFVADNREILLEYWETYCSDELCDRIKI